MTQQDDITQRVLTTEQRNEFIRRTSFISESDRDTRAAFVDEIARAALASAPVAGEAVLRIYAEGSTRTVTEWLDGARDLPDGDYKLYAAPQASTVAREAQPSRQTLLDAIWRHGNARAMAEHNIAYRDEVRSTADALLALFDAAPQASAENVRNAALEEAARVFDGMTARHEALRSTGPFHSAYRGAATVCRDLKQPQADKDGGQQRAGDDLIHALGECRDAFPTPDIAGSRLDLLWQEAMSDPTAVPAYVKACVARAALSATQAEQGERDE
ncbi:hypothetical protein ACOTF2_06980 [Achromobacter xylosoxidans]